MSLISRILGRKVAGFEPTEDVLPVGDLLKEATKRGRESITIDPYKGVPQNLHISATRHLGLTYVSMVCGSVLGGAGATVESAVCIMVAYTKFCEYKPGTRELCCVESAPHTGMQLIDRVRFLVGPFRAPVVFCPDTVTHDFLKQSAGFKARAVWEGAATLDLVSVGVSAVLNDLESGVICLPSHKGRCSPSVELLKSELGSWSPKAWPSMSLLAFAVCSQACRRFAPKMPVEKYTGADGGWRLRRAAPIPDPTYLRREPELQRAKQAAADRQLEEYRRRGDFLVTCGYVPKN